MKTTSQNKNIATIYEIAQITLSERYKLCDQKGHKTPDEKTNYCNYCHRHLTYRSSKVDSIIQLRNSLSFEQQPLDAAWLNNQREEEINVQRSEDLLGGLAKIVKELALV